MTLLRTGLAPRWGLPLRCGLAVSGWLAVAAETELSAGSALRALVTAVFLLVCPGLAAARWARSAEEREIGWTAILETAVLAVVVSLALSVLAVVPFYLNGAFTTLRVLMALAVVTSSLALLPLPGRAGPRALRAAPDPDPVAPPADPSQPLAPERETTKDPGASRNTGPARRGGPAADRPAQPGGRVPGLLPFVAGTGLAVGVTVVIAARRRR
ncbi:hypothetical protein [Streptomyces sp. NBC_01235]|uniref:hypothetical protein n=1 Tax=Streptomyces sp. NBC_01235 TaxID=2903788 RepID=UPI002E159E42|nr:hypothetical protein OG289_42855 [Streptomyces sp. NBC_01235]